MEFNEYKKTLDKALLNVPFIYSGDILKLNREVIFEEIKSFPSLSNEFILESFTQIYKETLNDFFSKKYKSISINYKNISLKDISKISKDNGIQFPRFSLSSLYSYRKVSDDILMNDVADRIFPDYFYPISAYSVNKINFFYYTPSTIDSNIYNFWIIDRPIQCLVYIIQNMDYKISDIGSNKFLHTMKFPIFECQYDVLNIQVKDVQKNRDSILSTLLS